MSRRPECAWVGCINPPTVRGVCNAHYCWTRKAGKRAASGRRLPPRPVPELPRRPLPARERLDEYEHLIRGGAWPADAVARCGWPTLRAALESALTYGRHDLADTIRDEMRHCA